MQIQRRCPLVEIYSRPLIVRYFFFLYEKENKRVSVVISKGRPSKTGSYRRTARQKAIVV
jgi:hypothetical protein